jgi:hypothetical protein
MISAKFDSMGRLPSNRDMSPSGLVPLGGMCCRSIARWRSSFKWVSSNIQLLPLFHGSFGSPPGVQNIIRYPHKTLQMENHLRSSLVKGTARSSHGRPHYLPPTYCNRDAKSHFRCLYCFFFFSPSGSYSISSFFCTGLLLIIDLLLSPTLFQVVLANT